MNSRAFRRAMERAAKSKKKAGVRHLTAKQIIEERGLGKWMQFVPLTQDQINQLDSFLLMHYEEIRIGMAEDVSWMVVLSSILEGYVFSKWYFDNPGEDKYQRIFKQSAKLFDSAWCAYQEHKQTLEQNIKVIRDNVDVLLAMRNELSRAECDGVIDHIEKNYEALCHEVFDGSPKSFSIAEGRYI